MPDCSDNCGCKVKIERNEDEVSWMKKLMIGNLVTAIVILVGVVFQLVIWLAKTPNLP